MNRRLCICLVCLALVSLGFTSESSNAQAPQVITNTIGLQLARIPSGTFTMGSPDGEADFLDDDEQEHRVTISSDFYLGVYEVTQAQYQKVMGENPSHFQGKKVAERDPETKKVTKDVDSSNHPVENVSSDEATEFCQRLSQLTHEKSEGRVYRLPTEAEWEFACRAGSGRAYVFGNDASELGDFAWYNKNGDYKTHPVGQKKPNAWGLYDMHGNVWEFCADRYGAYPQSEVVDPKGPSDDSEHVFRGGSWLDAAKDCRSAERSHGPPSTKGHTAGFRVALSFTGNASRVKLPPTKPLK